MITERVVAHLRKIPNGWKGNTSKKPSVKAINKVKKILLELETGHMPWPKITPSPNGGLIMTWQSSDKDIMVTIDTTGYVQFMTSVRVLDPDTEAVNTLEAEGQVFDMKTIDHMMAWYMVDRAGNC